MLESVGGFSSRVSSAAAGPPAVPTFIEIGTPRADQREGRTFRSVGTADVFEAAMIFRLRDASGHLVKQGSIQATAGSGTPGSWARNFKVPDSAPAGDYTLRVLAMDMDGSGVAASDKVTFHVPRLGASGSGFDPGFIDVAPATSISAHGRKQIIVGSSNTFEGSMEYRVRDESGKLVRHGSIQATSGTGTAGTFAKTISLASDAKPGLYTVSVFERSAEDGSIMNRDKVQFQVTP